MPLVTTLLPERREIALEGKMSRDAIRQILAREFLQQTQSPEFGVLRLCSDSIF
jgi:hypothetical protein